MGADVSGEAGAASATPLYSWRFASAQFNEASNELLVAGQAVQVEPRPLRLLAELLRHTNEVVTKEELFEVVWEGRVTVDNVLANAVTKLRKALGAQAGARIVNVPRVGYRLMGPVERVVVGETANAVPALSAGMPVPGRSPFVLTRALGHTGRGDVWLAQHSKTKDQRVFKFATTSDGLRQLKREFTLFRLLKTQLGDRADFVALLNANFSEQPFWLESEYGGEDLAQWAQVPGRLQGMSTAERVALFIGIAGAVADAHRVGVLHKDLKPANVLIGGTEKAWRVQLIDFGSGRALDPHQLKQLGLTAMGMTVTNADSSESLSGTPLYLAPEVLAGQPSTVQSDVYALGVMLYQLLVGDFRHVLATGWEGDVADPLLRQDIAAATQGRPAERLGSAADLLLRLETLEARRAQALAQENVRIRQQAMEVDLLRRQQRRPWVIASVLFLLVGLATSAWLYASASQAAKRAQVEAMRAQRVSEFLHQDVLEAPDVVSASRSRPIQMLEVLRKASMASSTRFASDPVTEAIVHRKLAHTFLRMGSLNDATKELNANQRLLDGKLPPDDPERLIARFYQVWLLAWGERHARAAEELSQAEALAGTKRLQANSELAYAALRGRLETMLQTHQWAQAISVGERMVAVADAVYSPQHNLALDARVKLLELNLFAGRIAQVERLNAEVSASPYNAKDARTDAQLRLHAFKSNAAMARLRPDDAAKEMEAAKALALTSQQPNEYYLAWVVNSLCIAQNAMGQPANAVPNCRQAQELFMRTIGPEHVHYKLALLQGVQALIQLGKSTQAMAQLNELREWYRPHMAGGKNGQAEWLYAVALNQQGEHQAALDFLDGLPASVLVTGGFSPEGAAFRLDLERARALRGLGQGDQAKALLQGLLSGDRAVKVWGWERDQAAQVQKALGG